MSERLRTRTTNPYGQDEADVARALEMKALVEPLLRASATLEIDTRVPLDQVVDRILRHTDVEGRRGGGLADHPTHRAASDRECEFVPGRDV
jgi:hypothetical protein